MAESKEIAVKCYSETEEQLLEMYKKLQVGDHKVCKTCRQCNKEQCRSRPITAYRAKDKMKGGNIRVLFVGKSARGCFPNDPDEKNRGVSEGFNNAFSWDFTALGWAFWRYTSYIIEECIEEGLPIGHVAMTNMVKCNGSNTVDTTTESMKDCCIKDLELLKREIQIIKPTHVVFYTGWYYDGHVRYAFDSVKAWDNMAMRKIGACLSPWGAGVGVVDGREIQFLRVCHPERKKKGDFVNGIVNWINDTKDVSNS